MKRLFTFTLLLGALIAGVSCSKTAGENQPQPDPLYGLWMDTDRNYALILNEDSIHYLLDELDGIEFHSTFTKQDANTLIFEIPENGHGKLILHPETHDLTMNLELKDGPMTLSIPAYDHFDIATTAPNIASTLLYDEDLTTVADTLRYDRFLPIGKGLKGEYVELLLPDGRKGWIKGKNINMLRSRVTPNFLEKRYSIELHNLRGHVDRIESYSFSPMGNGKTGVMFNLMYLDGTPAQERYFAGDINGNRLNVTHDFDNYNDWEESNLQAATPLDQPFEIVMYDGVNQEPYIRAKNRIYTQVQEDY